MCRRTLEPGDTQRSHVPVDTYFRRADLPQSLHMRWVFEADGLSLQYHVGRRGVYHHNTPEGAGVVALTITRSFPPSYLMPDKNRVENGSGAPGFDLLNALHRL